MINTFSNKQINNDPLARYITNKIIEKITPKKDLKETVTKNPVLMSAATALAIEAAALIKKADNKDNKDNNDKN